MSYAPHDPTTLLGWEEGPARDVQKLTANLAAKRTDDWTVGHTRGTDGRHPLVNNG